MLYELSFLAKTKQLQNVSPRLNCTNKIEFLLLHIKSCQKVNTLGNTNILDRDA